MVVNGFTKSCTVFVCPYKYFMASWLCQNAAVSCVASKNKPIQDIFSLCIKRGKKRELKCIMRHSMFLVLCDLHCC